MPRQPKAYLHRGWYVSNLGGTRHKLCRETDGSRQAQIELGKILDQRAQGTLPRQSNLTVVELVALFLDSVKVERSESTYTNYSRWLGEFCKLHGQRRVRDITPLIAEAFRNNLSRRTWKRRGRGTANPYKPKTINHALISLKRCWNWGIQKKLLPPSSPFSDLALLFAEGRQRVVTDREFQHLLRGASDSHFRQFLLTLRYTGARPGEIRGLTWAMVDWANHRFVLQRHKTSRTTKVSKPRLIPFPPVIERLLRWRLRRFGAHTPAVFLNQCRQPWNKERIINRMAVARRRAGLRPDENGESLVLYSNRHTFLTAAAASANIGGPMLQQLAGHSSPAMTARYVHLANADLYRANVQVAEVLKPQRPSERPEGTSGTPR